MKNDRDNLGKSIATLVRQWQRLDAAIVRLEEEHGVPAEAQASTMPKVPKKVLV
jgi:hypothetical protein